MTKLEWKGCPRSNKIEDIEVLLIGDSMIKNINCEQFRNTTWLYAYPGITAEQLRFHLQNEVGLPPPSKIGGILTTQPFSQLNFFKLFIFTWEQTM